MGGARDKTREGDTSRDGVVISRLSRPPPAPRGLSRDPFEQVQFLGFLRLMPPRSIPRSPRFPLLRGKSDKRARQGSLDKAGREEEAGDRVCRESELPLPLFLGKGRFFEEQVSPSFLRLRFPWQARRGSTNDPLAKSVCLAPGHANYGRDLRFITRDGRGEAGKR